ncbi:MAG: hypothetical protein GVY20_14365 [Bacteroidetes bacterium]|jgi:hypothetical protein|nr:hypothetical protein [Bacteroidota bacterium]
MWILKSNILLSLIGLFITQNVMAQRSFELLKRFPAEEAFQAVAVDSSHFYAIASKSIGKYDKITGKKVTSTEIAVKHLNSGVVINGKLFTANSNYPEIPMTSSVEILDTKTLEHNGSYSLGIRWGSLTWIDRENEYWWAMFGHYNEFAHETGKDNRWTTLVQFNDDWQPQESWVLPPEVLERLDEKTISGGSWGPDGRLYLSGHDRGELYAMRLPEMGSVLKLDEIIPIENEGQGIAWDRSVPGVLYTIVRSKLAVNVLKLKE